MASIYKSFDQKLPTLEVFGNQEDHRTHVSGNTTKECTPPRCSIHIPVSHWHQLASRLCLEPCRDDLENEHLPVVENLIGLKSEGDVVNASTLYLTNPVHVGYQAVYPKDYYLNELTKPRHDGTRSSRVDRAYFLGEPDNKQQPGNSTNIFAALEYKKSGTINRERFQSGIVTNYKAFEMAQEQSRYVDRDQNNVMILLKQAVHYAWRYKTPFIAICDYNTLLLFYMSKQDGNYGGPVRTIVLSTTKNTLLIYIQVHIYDHCQRSRHEKSVSRVSFSGQIPCKQKSRLASESRRRRYIDRGGGMVEELPKISCIQEP